MWVFVAVRVVRSGSHYALAKPRQGSALHRRQPRAEKYKAKVFIDTAIYRGGDVGAAWVLEALRRIAGLMALTLAGSAGDCVDGTGPVARARSEPRLWPSAAARGFEAGLPAGAPSSAS